MKTLGGQIKLLRRQILKMSQADLGVSLDVSRQAVSFWEKDICHPTLGHLLDLSKSTGVTFVIDSEAYKK